MLIQASICATNACYGHHKSHLMHARIRYSFSLIDVVGAHDMKSREKLIILPVIGCQKWKNSAKDEFSTLF